MAAGCGLAMTRLDIARSIGDQCSIGPRLVDAQSTLEQIEYGEEEQKRVASVSSRTPVI
jgi:hypothetical protein